MSHKQNIDIYFREVFASDGPEISVLDEEQFLQNMRLLNKEKKRRKAFFIWGFSCIILGLAIAGIYQVRVFSGNATSVHTAKTEPNTFQAESKMLANSSEINSSNQIKLTQIKPEEERSLSPKKEQHNDPRKVYVTGTETINMPPNGDEIVAINVQEKIAEFKANEIKMQGLRLVNLTLPASKMLGAPEFAKIKHATNGLQIGASSGFANMQGRWDASPNEKSHQDMSSVTRGMKTRGNGIVNGISVGYALGRFTFGMGLTQQLIQTQTQYNRKVENVPVIDSASGGIKGYLNLGATKAYTISETKANLTQFFIPMYAGYKIISKPQKVVEITGGFAFNLSSNTTLHPFDINTMKNSVSAGNYNRFGAFLGLNYFYKPNQRWDLGLQFRAQIQNASFGLKFGSTDLHYTVFSLSPVVRFNLK